MVQAAAAFLEHGLVPSKLAMSVPVDAKRYSAEQCLTATRNEEPSETPPSRGSTSPEPRSQTAHTSRARGYSQKKKKTKKKNKKKSKKKSPKSSSTQSYNQSSKSSHPFPTPLQKPFATNGSLPDVQWRSIPWKHLRRHPFWEALPPVPSQVSSWGEARCFPQDSWQWQALHEGRCTTSVAAAALGFLEPTVGQVMGVPASWRGHGPARVAYRRMQASPSVIRTLDELNSLLESNDDETSSSEEEQPEVWRLPSSHSAFAADYTYETTQEEWQARARAMQRQLPGLRSRVRFLWGNAQEATALLTAVNYFCRADADTKLQEVGLCGTELDWSQYSSVSSSSSLLIGASPDALLYHSDGRVEVVEVKNHCPFFINRRGRFSIQGHPISNPSSVSPQYVSQLQLEMLCVGPQCRSAILVRQTATQGAVLLRMERDDAWIEEMLHWLDRFQADYCDTGKAPPPDFFWNQPGNRAEQSRYRRFVSKTMEIRTRKAKVIATLSHSELQRSPQEASMFLA